MFFGVNFVALPFLTLNLFINKKYAFSIFTKLIIVFVIKLIQFKELFVFNFKDVKYWALEKGCSSAHMDGHNYNVLPMKRLVAE